MRIPCEIQLYDFINMRLNSGDAGQDRRIEPMSGKFRIEQFRILFAKCPERRIEELERMQTDFFCICGTCSGYELIDSRVADGLQQLLIQLPVFKLRNRRIGQEYKMIRFRCIQLRQNLKIERIGKFDDVSLFRCCANPECSFASRGSCCLEHKIAA